MIIGTSLNSKEKKHPVGSRLWRLPPRVLKTEELAEVYAFLVDTYGHDHSYSKLCLDAIRNREKIPKSIWG